MNFDRKGAYTVARFAALRNFLGLTMLLAVTGWVSGSHAAGFDCTSPRLSSLERLICQDQRLSALDDQMKEAYEKSLSSSSDKTSLTNEQNGWLRMRNRCYESQCVYNSYRDRLALLQSKPIPVDPYFNPPPDLRPSIVGPVTSTPSGAVAQRYHIQSAQGYPVLEAGSGLGESLGTQLLDRLQASNFRMEASMHRTGATLPYVDTLQWTLMIRALGLRLTPPPQAERGPELTQFLACEFLSADGVNVMFGRSGVYGPLQDMCSADFKRNDSPSLQTFMAVGSERFYQQEMPRLIAEAPPLPITFILKWPQRTSSSGYDSVRGGYRLESSGRYDDVFGTKLNTPAPRFWPVSAADARAFEIRHNTTTSIPVYFGMKVTITGISSLLNGGDTRKASGLGGGAVWNFDEGDVVIYEDEHLTRPLYTYAPPQSPVSAASSISGRSQANVDGATSARRFGVEVIKNLSVLRIIPTVGNDGATLQQFTDFYPEPSTQAYNWTRLVRAMALRALPAATLPALADRDAIRLGCLYATPQRRQRLGMTGHSYYCATGAGMAGQEFETKDLADVIRKTDLPDALAAAPTLPFTFLYVSTATIKPWSSSDGGYPFENGVSYSRAMAFGTPIGFRVPSFWPLDEAGARDFNARTPPVYGERKVYLATPVTVTGATLDPSDPANTLLDLTGLPTNREWQFQVGAPVLYADPGLTRPLFTYPTPAAFPAASINTPAAANPKPLGPLPLNNVPANSEAILLTMLSKDPDIAIDWAAAAKTRLAIDMNESYSDDAHDPDPWGRFFLRRIRTREVPLSPAEVSAFRDWTMKRSKVLPPLIQSSTLAFSVPGPLAINVFDQLPRAAFRSAWLFSENHDNEIRYYDKWFSEKGISPTQTRPMEINLTYSGLNAVVFGVLPTARGSYTLDVPSGLPAKPSWDRRSSDAMGTMDVQYTIEQTEIVPAAPGMQRRAIALYLQPVGAQIRRLDGVILASTTFARRDFILTTPTPGAPIAPATPTSAPATTAQTPGVYQNAAPGEPLKRLMGPATGFDVLGIRIGTKMADAEALIRVHMHVVHVYTTPTFYMEGKGPGKFPGKLFVSDVPPGDRPDDVTRPEQIAIYDTPQSDERVVALWRQITFDELAAADIKQRLVDKYTGLQARVGTEQPPTFYTGTASACAGLANVGLQLLGGRWQDSGKDITAYGYAVPPQMPVFEPNDVRDWRQCGPVLTTRIQSTFKLPGESGTRDILINTLFDPGLSAWIAAQPVSLPTDLPKSDVKF